MGVRYACDQGPRWAHADPLDPLYGRRAHQIAEDSLNTEHRSRVLKLADLTVTHKDVEYVFFDGCGWYVAGTLEPLPSTKAGAFGRKFGDYTQGIAVERTPSNVAEPAAAKSEPESAFALSPDSC